MPDFWAYEIAALMSVNWAEAVATVTTEALAGTVDDAPDEIEVALPVGEVSVVEPEDDVEEAVEDTSLADEELAEDEGAAEDGEAIEDEEAVEDETPALEIPDAVATWEASESLIDFKTADGIHVVSELEYPGNPRPKMFSMEKSCIWSAVNARSQEAERLAAFDAPIDPAPVFANSP
jgi:hypothetical protein